MLFLNINFITALMMKKYFSKALLRKNKDVVYRHTGLPLPYEIEVSEESPYVKNSTR